MGTKAQWEKAKERRERQVEQCSRCRQEKPYNQFNYSKHRSNGLSSLCKDCDRERKNEQSRRKYWDMTEEERQEYKRKKNLRKFRLTPEEYNRIFQEQSGRCAICKKEETALQPIKNKQGIKNLCVDHCHKTNKFRALLCTRCNTGIGMFEENIETMKAAIQYLEDKKNA
jgi:hypothetical protein